MSLYIDDIYTAKIYHWLLFLRNNNLGFLTKKSINIAPHKVKQDDSFEAVDAYHEINDQVISSFGIEESFLAQKKKEEEIAILKLDYIINGKKQKRTQWKIKELDLQSPEEYNNVQYDIEKEIEIVSKSIGVGIINIKDYTIHQYLIAKKSLRNGNK